MVLPDQAIAALDGIPKNPKRVVRYLLPVVNSRCRAVELHSVHALILIHWPSDCTWGKLEDFRYAAFDSCFASAVWCGWRWILGIFEMGDGRGDWYRRLDYRGDRAVLAFHRQRAALVPVLISLGDEETSRSLPFRLYDLGGILGQ